jgi:uncharacterized protein
MNAAYWIEKLNLLPHPEGGHYRETYRCRQSLAAPSTGEQRNISTAIYFLLEGENKSHFHRIKSDELWFFHEGATLEIFILTGNGVEILQLGKDAEAGESLQAVIPAGLWFGAKLKNGTGYALVSCTVAPGFDFRDFEMAEKENLLREFPENETLIKNLSL